MPARAWGEAMRARLVWGDGDGALAGWDTLPPRADHTAEEMRPLMGCLPHKAGRRHDRTARTGGTGWCSCRSSRAAWVNASGNGNCEVRAS